METAKKKKKLIDIPKLEKRLISAINRGKSTKIISILLSALHENNVHQGLAVDKAKEYLRTA